MKAFIAVCFGVVGSALIGVHFKSLAVAIGVYCVIVSIGNWEA